MPSPPIGYIKDADGNWLIDEPKAKIVRRIYQLYLDGASIHGIANILTSEKIPTARGKDTWSPGQIKRILVCPEYRGDMVNFKLRRISFKNKKQVPVDPSEWAVFHDTQPAIIDRSQWQLVQDKLAKIQRTVPIVKHDPAVFTGFLYCAECGCKCYAKQATRNCTLHYICSGYSKSKTVCTIHYITDKVVRRRVLKAIRDLLDEFRQDENSVTTRLQGFRQNSLKNEIKDKQKMIDKLHSDIIDLERKIRKAYEDKVSNTLNDTAFNIISDQMIEERNALVKVSEQLEKDVDILIFSSTQINSFIDVLKKYRDIDVTEITQPLLLDFIDKIAVHDTGISHEKSENKKIDIYFRAVGRLDLFTK